MVRTQRIICCLRDMIDDLSVNPVELGRGPGEYPCCWCPLVVIEVSEFRLNSFGSSRVVCVDPTGLMQHRSSLPIGNEGHVSATKKLEIAKALLGKEYDSVQQAGQDIHMRIYGSRTNVFRRIECFVSANARGEDLLRAPGIVERIPSAGEMVDSRFHPDAAGVNVVMHVPLWAGAHSESSGSQAGGWGWHLFEPTEPPPAEAFWLPLGGIRPITSSRRLGDVTRHMSDEEVLRELSRMHATGFSSRKHARDRQQPLEEGEIGSNKTRRSKKKPSIVEGKVHFLDETKLPRDDMVGRLPFEVVSSALAGPSDAPAGAPALKHATLRSFADGSMRNVPAGWLVPLESTFEKRCMEHLCVASPLCMACRSMVAAAKSRGARQLPPVSAAVEWRYLCSKTGLVLPECTARVHEYAGTASSGSAEGSTPPRASAAPARAQ